MTVSNVQFANAASLIAALKSVGFSQDQIEQHEKPVRLDSIFGTHSEAEIVIRKLAGATKETPGALYYGDLGFAKGEKGYVPVMEDYDRKYCGFDDPWFGKLKQAYGTAEVTREFQQAGMYVETQKLTSGDMQLVVQGF
jgi:hypothetical protein